MRLCSGFVLVINQYIESGQYTINYQETSNTSKSNKKKESLS